MEEIVELKLVLKVLCLEDVLQDAELLNEILADAGFHVHMDIATDEESYLSYLKSRKYDIILSDYSLPGFNAPTALKLALTLVPEVPFICVSGTIGEDTAVELLKQGATDYVLKDRLGRLAFAVNRALEMVEERDERKKAEEALNNSQQELRKFATHLQHVREEEKINLAREIHDDLAQISVALKFDLGLFKRKLSKGIKAITSEELLSKLNDFSDQVDNSIKSARRIINGLRPELIELLGFEEGCKSYLNDFEETHHISTQFESTILNLNINLKQSVALFRILQESLNNIAKHAKATFVSVKLLNSNDKLVMEIIDNGVGFDENNKSRNDSYGLIGMKERVFLLEGNLKITSKVGKGTTVRVEIPYEIK